MSFRSIPCQCHIWQAQQFWVVQARRSAPHGCGFVSRGVLCSKRLRLLHIRLLIPRFWVPNNETFLKTTNYGNDRTLFIITSATGIVREFCNIIKCCMSFGGWSGYVNLVCFENLKAGISNCNYGYEKLRLSCLVAKSTGR
jgi:hypothetical protein